MPMELTLPNGDKREIEPISLQDLLNSVAFYKDDKGNIYIDGINSSLNIIAKDINIFTKNDIVLKTQAGSQIWLNPPLRKNGKPIDVYAEIIKILEIVTCKSFTASDINHHTDKIVESLDIAVDTDKVKVSTIEHGGITYYTIKYQENDEDYSLTISGKNSVEFHIDDQLIAKFLYREGHWGLV